MGLRVRVFKSNNKMSEGLAVLNANKNTATFPSRCVYSYMQPRIKEPTAIFLLILSNNGLKILHSFCEAQARVRQGSARDGSQGERPQSLNPCLELTLKLVATTTTHHHHHHPKVSIHLTNGLAVVRCG